MGITVLVGTVKGGFVLRSKDRRQWSFEEPIFKGWKVTASDRTPQGDFLVATASPVYGTAIHRSADLGSFDQIHEQHSERTSDPMPVGFRLDLGQSLVQGLVPLGAALAGDPRCRMVEGDFFALASDPETGFDPDRPGRRFDAILVDIDHSPQDLLSSTHAAFYRPDGLRALAAQLKPGGVFALWSNDPPDAGFTANMEAVFTGAQARVVEFDNPLQGRKATATVYAARRGCASE